MGGYSTGMKQKAKLAQALAHDPRLVLLDEPTNGLDPAARDEMLGLVRRIGHDFGIAVIVTSHLLGELERVSDNVVVLDGGRLLRASRTDEFLDATGVLLVEVLGDDAQARMAAALTGAGVTTTRRGGMLTVDATDRPDAVRDLIRDTAGDLGLGLVRLQVDHRRIEDVFADPDTDPDADLARHDTRAPPRRCPMTDPSAATPAGGSVIHDLGLPALHRAPARCGGHRPRADPHRVPQRLRAGPLGQVEGAALRAARPEPAAGRHHRRRDGLRRPRRAADRVRAVRVDHPGARSASSWRRRPRCSSRATCGTAPSRCTSPGRCGRAPTPCRAGRRCSAPPWCSCCCPSSSSTPWPCSVSSTSPSRPARSASRSASPCCSPCRSPGSRASSPRGRPAAASRWWPRSPCWSSPTASSPPSRASPARRASRRSARSPACSRRTRSTAV